MDTSKLVKGGVKGFGVGTFLGILGYVVGAIGDLYITGVSANLGAAVGFLAGLIVGLAEVLE